MTAQACHSGIGRLLQIVGGNRVYLSAVSAYAKRSFAFAGKLLHRGAEFVGVSFGKALRAALPIYVVFLVTICFTIYFPKVVLWLPKQVIPESVGCFKSPAGTGYICPN